MSSIEDGKRATRAYFREMRERQNQPRPQARPLVPIERRELRREPERRETRQPERQPIYIQSQPQQPPVIIQQPAPQQPVYFQQPQPIYSQQHKSQFGTFIAMFIVLTAIMFTGMWLYQGGVDLAIQNWELFLHGIKDFFATFIS